MVARSIAPIRNDADHKRALAEIDRLMDAEPGSPDGDRLEILSLLVENWEVRRFPIDPPDPVEAIKFVMEQTGRSRGDLAALIGSASRASEILRRRRPLTMEMVRRLNEAWGIPAELLIRRYELTA